MQQFIYSFQPFEGNKQLSFYFAFLLIFFVKREIWGRYNYNALIHFRYQYSMWVFVCALMKTEDEDTKVPVLFINSWIIRKKKQENLHQRFSKHLQVIGKWVIHILHVFVFFLVLFIMHHRKYFVKYIFFSVCVFMYKKWETEGKRELFSPWVPLWRSGERLGVVHCVAARPGSGPY